LRIRTRVFDVALRGPMGYWTDRRLAEAMGIHETTLHRVKKGIHPPSNAFIAGALKAYPGKGFDDLFYVDVDDTPAPVRELAEVAS
jgi:hypothetical protein